MIITEIRNKYSLIDKIIIAFTILKTKLICHRARIIRSGFQIRGKSLIFLGEGFTTGRNCRLEAFYTSAKKQKKICIGSNVQINDNVHLSAIESIRIGDNTLIASHVYISDSSHGSYKGDEYDTSPEISPILREYFVAPVEIGYNVWIGEGVIVMPGVKIGNGSIIGAHSIVKNDIPENCIAVGIPAKPIKHYNFNTNRWDRITKIEYT